MAKVEWTDEAKAGGDIAHVVDIWDTRMNPKALIKRINN